MDNNTVITNTRRVALCRVTSGADGTLPPIAQVAFGTGGVDGEGAVVPPTADQTGLRQEVGRYAIEETDYPIPTTARYTVTIPAGDLGGEMISEAALVDSEGRLCAIRNMLPKGKDEDVPFIFTFDDEF